MRETETLSRPLDFFFQGASAPCEKKIEEAEAVGRAAAAPVTTYHARDRDALPTYIILYFLLFYRLK